MDFLGIDFSGDATQWKQRVSRPNVWIARLSAEPKPKVISLQPVQGLPGSAAPCDRLVTLLARGDFIAAGIDAPFSVPASYVPDGNWHQLIEIVGKLPYDGRPFPRADVFLDAVIEGGWPKNRLKHLRVTDRFWAAQKINVRSTLWWTPRGGAPFAAACMKLISRCGQPCWPWTPNVDRGVIVEAFAAAQLKEWELPYQKYNGEEGYETRKHIIEQLRGRVDFVDSEDIVRQSADALDAVLAAFAGIACHRGTWRKPSVAYAHFEQIAVEGWMSVHR